MGELARSKGHPWVGTSGWSYAHWRGRFYPPGLGQGRWLAYYAGFFSTVELNGSFYRLPSEISLRRWYEETPPGFLFAVKASRLITHYRRLVGVEEALAQFVGRAALLGDKLGPILCQLPPGLRRDDELLGRFLAALPPGWRYAVEFRDASWYAEPVYDLLATWGVAFCTHDYPRLESPLVVTAPFAYLRFHGASGRYVGEYGAGGLAPWVEAIKNLSDGGRDVFAYFNNDAEAQAVRDALALRAALVGSAVG